MSTINGVSVIGGIRFAWPNHHIHFMGNTHNVIYCNMPKQMVEEMVPHGVVKVVAKLPDLKLRQSPDYHPDLDSLGELNKQYPIELDTMTVQEFEKLKPKLRKPKAAE